MKTAVLILTAALLAAPAGSRMKGRAARFHGLIMGKSRHAESVRVLGAPAGASPMEGALELIADSYECPGLFPFPYQRVDVHWNRRTGTISSVEVQLTRAIPIEKLEEQFGPGWGKVTWASRECQGAGAGSAELYLSSTGDFATWENLARGLTYWPTPPSFLYSEARTLPERPGDCR